MADHPATTWGVGEYPLMAQRLKPAAQRAVDLARVAPGDRVLDLACGTGNAALMAAARGAEQVIGVDFEPALLAIARERGEGLDLTIDWRVGDLGALPVADASVDVVVSAFGIMYASDQPRAAAELARVCAPGARVVLASWTPGGVMPGLGAAVAPFVAPPPLAGLPPSRWGDPDAARALLTDAGVVAGAAHPEALTLTFENRLSAVAFLVRTAGHVVAERPRLEAEGRWPQLLAAVAAHVSASATTDDDGRVALSLEYLLVEARAAAEA
ncbi:2-methoxy-6-polyprenyl-1,4-benzoquinol methylase, mitochondrial [Baekduia alba]|uniref:class I SAM-dependent methyltransferase n=1 Tax=Baekduia alba TaxID=2997333 RepID=UPI002341BCC8|nr:methyltransferase domain-containing protein [Baekduia alba]WCB91979.1 2-methoxy-6-polyprenyl-1,4-benzoquinol methylase, mitochondrial [Baekduia alba]